jgi:hypothetical protein
LKFAICCTGEIFFQYKSIVFHSFSILVNFSFSLGELGIPWADLSDQTKREIKKFLLSGAMNEEQLSQSISACQLVNFIWWDQDKMENHIFQTIQRLYGEKDQIKHDAAPWFVKTIVALGKRPFQWDLLPKEVQDSLRNATELFASVFTEQEITDLSDG